MRWFVDGMNVIGTRPDGWWSDRDAAMLRLVDLLERWAAAEGEDVIVVFERAAVAADPLDGDRGRARAATASATRPTTRSSGGCAAKPQPAPSAW